MDDPTIGALHRVCLDDDVDEAVAALGGPRSPWDLYRGMVRTRIAEAVAASLPRTRDTLGTAALERAVHRWLAAGAPGTRYVRALCLEFVAWALEHPVLLEGAEAPPWLPSLLRYEAALREVEIADDTPPPPSGRVLAMGAGATEACPQRLLRLPWGVHAEGVPVEGAWVLLVYRAPVTDVLQTLALSPAGERLYTGLCVEGRTLEEALVRLTLHGATADPAYVAATVDFLLDLEARGVICAAG